MSCLLATQKSFSCHDWKPGRAMRSTNKKQEKVETDPDGSESEGGYLNAKNGNKNGWCQH
jgi:hypothetical protein